MDIHLEISHRHSLPVVGLQEGPKEDFPVQYISKHDVSLFRHTVSLTALCQALMAFMYPNKNVNTQSFGNGDLGTAQSLGVSLGQQAQSNIKFIAEPGTPFM